MRTRHPRNPPPSDEQGIRMRRLREINERLTTDRITAHQIKQDHNFTKLTKLTWKTAGTKRNTTLQLVPKMRGLVGISV